MNTVSKIQPNLIEDALLKVSRVLTLDQEVCSTPSLISSFFTDNSAYCQIEHIWVCLRLYMIFPAMTDRPQKHLSWKMSTLLYIFVRSSLLRVVSTVFDLAGTGSIFRNTV